MADIPMINNLREKLIPGSRDSGHEDVDDGEEISATQHDVLEQFRIAPVTELDEDMLTPSKLNKVQFNVIQPKGFSFKQVEAFHKAVTKSVQGYIHLLEQRDRDVHKLATEVDKYRTDVQNVRFQLEVLQASGQAILKDDGSYAKESDLSAEQLRIIELENELETTKTDLAFERRKNATLTEDNDALREEVNSRTVAPKAPAPTAAPGAVPTNADLAELQELRERQAELDEWEAAVVVEYNRMESEYNKSVEEVERLKGELANAESQVASMGEQSVDTAEVDRLKGELETAQSALAEYEKAYHEYEELYKTLETSYGELETAYKALETAYGELEVAYKTLETAYEEQGVEKNGEVESLIGNIAALEAQVESLRVELAEKENSAPAGRSIVPGYKLPEGVTPEDLGL